ncbi:ADP-ribosylation factor-like protein 6-interacting protein 1 isoform X2 [Lineus longissimus]|uniref:ADP-ribosylation factor-like protein 6-interacting protein 1 isoform X2 n=1 Tax=Lineus longissimus TaxID=88925 RepID=UPI002B4C8D02
MAETADMAEVPKNYTEEENDLVSKIKKELEGWREVLLPLNKMLTWEKPHYPAILVGAISFIFILIWYLEPSVLTTFSLIGFHVCLIDYLVPTVATNLFRSDNWTGVQEREFENICIRIHNAKVHFHSLRQGLGNLKRDKPKTYFVAVMSSLAILAWIGNIINNLLLTYLIRLSGLIGSPNPPREQMTMTMTMSLKVHQNVRQKQLYS